MSANRLAALLEELSTKNAAVTELYDAIGDAEPTPTQYESVKTLNREIEAIDARIADAKEMQAGRDAAEARKSRVQELLTAPAAGLPVGNRSGAGSRQEAAMQAAVKSLGQRFLENDEFQAWYKSTAPNGFINDRVRVNSPAVLFDGIGLKTLVTGVSDTTGGALVFNQVNPLVEYPYARPLTLRDVFTVGQTQTDTIEFPRMTGVTNNAAPVAEATATTGSSGTKPESALALERTTVAVKTIAHWIPATKRALADAGQIRTLIDGFLRYGLEEELEDQMMAGDGTGENLLGLVNQTGMTAQAWDTDALTTLRKARTKARINGRATSTAFLMNPADWETIDLLQDNDQRYFFGGPTAMGNPRVWGLPIIESEAVPAGRAFTGDLRQAVLWDRERPSIQVTDSHSDFFIRNMVAILCELRAAFGVLRPAAIVDIDLTA